tara:strand:+ start:4145 stop:4891 length:747 start_codon:yes stop_codon:yes gene_type:complete
MISLNFNGIQWEPLGSLVAVRYATFLRTYQHEAKEFFYMGETQEEIKAEIDKIVYMLGKEPTDDLNQLHEYFADHEDEAEMSRLNHLIHYYELVDAGYPPRWGSESGNSEMVLFPKDYEEFTLERKPGYLYINYPHVGKHFAEIVFSNDLNVKKEQYQPQSLARTGFNVWLGPEVDGSKFMEKAQSVHKALKDKLELPELDDPALRLGYIPFARLKTDINSSDLIQHLLKAKIRHNNYTELFTNGRAE